MCDICQWLSVIGALHQWELLVSYLWTFFVAMLLVGVISERFNALRKRQDEQFRILLKAMGREDLLEERPEEA